MSHSSLCGVVDTSPKLSGSRFDGLGLVVAHSVEASPLIVLAKRRSGQLNSRMAMGTGGKTGTCAGSLLAGIKVVSVFEIQIYDVAVSAILKKLKIYTAPAQPNATPFVCSALPGDP